MAFELEKVFKAEERDLLTMKSESMVASRMYVLLLDLRYSPKRRIPAIA